jgi:glycosyltransferase involved in cell wall biosynthesis
MNLIALIPAHNEATRIQPVILAARKHLPVLVIDDGSTDATSDASREAGADVICQKPNQGKGAALKNGFSHILNQDWDGIITLDADGQHDPLEIPLFINNYDSTHADLIIGARDFSQMPLVRRFANSIGRVLFSWALGLPVKDNQSGYRLMSRRMVEASLKSDLSGFEFEVDVIVICAQQNFRLEWIPIRTIYSGQGSHINPIKHAAGFLELMWRVRQMMKMRS